MLGARRALFTRTLRLGDRGEDVRQVQQLLHDTGHDPGAVDGAFGPRTHEAVLAFQRAHGLQADGAVGPITRAALSAAAADTGGASGPTRRALSLHIGLNRVDDAAYGFRVPPLAGCINDANDMLDLARAQGFTTRQLLDSAATASAVTSALQEAARTLTSGDTFWISYSGHGSQVPDPSEQDSRSETWVLYDRQLIDNELYALWSLFEPGVRILCISDSCHSGTVTRALNQLNAEVSRATDEALQGVPSSSLPADLAVRLTLDLVGATSRVLADAGHPTPESASDVVSRAMSGLLARREGERSLAVAPEQPRLLPLRDAHFDAALRSGLYREAVAATAGAREPQCTVLLLSGCQDNQTSSDGTPDPSGHQNGAFTKLLRQEWSAARDYTDLHARIVRQMPSTQTPNLYWATTPDVAFQSQRPFTT